MSESEKRSSSEHPSSLMETPVNSRPRLNSMQQQRLADAALEVLAALQRHQEREAMKQAQELIARAARKS